MDEISKSFLQDDQGRIEPRETQMPLPSQKAHLHLGSMLIHNNIHHHINLHFYGPKLEKRFLHKFEIDQKFHQQIQWMALERAYRNKAKQEKISVFNLLQNKWTTNMVQANWNPDHHPDCGRCSNRAETFRHIFACTSQDASAAYKKTKTALITALRKANTSPLINSAIVTLGEEYRKGYEIPLKHHFIHKTNMN